MKILVTGGCGLIGSHVAAHYLNKGYQVTVMDNMERSKLLGHDVKNERIYFNRDRLKKLNANIFYGDVSNPAHWEVLDTERFDGIFHLAAQCGVPTSIDDPKRDFEVNTVGTLHMLEKAKKDNSIIVYASTNKVYPIHDDLSWFKDEDKWRWTNNATHENGWDLTMPIGSRTPYGTSKYAGDLYCQEYADYYGLRTGVFRMSCIYGDHQFGFEEQGWAAWFVIAALKGYPLTIFGDGSQVRDMLYVSDVVKAYDTFFKAAKNRDLQSGVWNLGGGPHNTLSLNECIRFLQIETGRDIEHTFKDWRPADQKVYTSDIRKLKDDLGWEPTIDPEEGLRRVIDWAERNLSIF